MKPFAVVGLIIVLFVACTGKRYGHYGYVKRGNDKVAEKTHRNRQQFFKQPERIVPMETAILLYKCTDTILPKAVALTSKTTSAVKCEVVKVPAETTTKTGSEAGTKPNKKAKESAWFGAATYFVLLVPIVGIIFSIVFALIAVSRGIKALDEIEADPEKYTNVGTAITGIALGTVFLAIGIFLILFLMISLVGFTIPFIPLL